MVPGEELWRDMMAMDGDTLELEVVRAYMDAGRTFSPEAMNGLELRLWAWVGTRIARRWDQTDEPPTVVRVTVTVAVQ